MVFVKFILYGLFGVILTEAGVGVTDSPVYYLMLLGILMAVDAISFIIAKENK